MALSGTMPPALTGLHALQVLAVSQRGLLRGQIQQGIGDLTSLVPCRDLAPARRGSRPPPSRSRPPGPPLLASPVLAFATAAPGAGQGTAKQDRA